MRLLSTLFRRYRAHIALLIVLGFLSGILEGIGITAIIPLFSYFLGQDVPGGNTIAQLIVRIFEFLPFAYSPVSLLALIILLFVVRAIVLVCFYYLRSRISSSFMIRTMNELLDKILRAQWGYLLRQRLGHAEVTITRDVRQGASLLENISQGVLVCTSLIIYIGLAVYISFPVTLATAACGGALLLLLQPLRSRVKEAARSAGRTEKRIAHFLNEHTLGLKTVKSAAVEGPVFSVGTKAFDSFKQLLIRSALFQGIGSSLMQPVALIFITFVFLFFYGKGTLELGSFLALVYLIQKIFTYVESGQAALHSVQERLPYAEHVLEFGEELSRNREENIGKEPFRFDTRIEFSDVTFGYGEAPVLRSIDFSIPKGSMVGLIGPSGSGKTSIADLLLRLFKPTSGAVLIDGKSIDAIDIHAWRRKIGYVSQDMFLLNDTIENNIRFYDTSLTREDIENGARLANCFEFIDKAPKGFDTVIGDRGLMLSVGQRQRIILARVLARKPELLILDEATSALDNESERLIQAAIENLKNRITVFIIAHRLSTVKSVDNLLVLKDGAIVEQGVPDQLLADRSSYFHKMYTQ